MSMTRGSLDASGLATLKELALVGAIDGRTKLSCADLAERLDASTQTASRRLRRLAEDSYIDREVVGDGQWVRITEAGTDSLRAEYATYRRIFEGEQAVALTGAVTAGMGEGRHYISLSGYMEQFRERLGYEPYPGTLNVALGEDSIARRPRLDGLEPVTIDGWEDDGRTYGPAYCYPATIAPAEETDGREQFDPYEPAHVIAPERTHHGEDNLEVIAPERLRETLGLADGDELTVTVEGR